MASPLLQTTYEVIVIGAGPAAWSAAIYLGRVGIKALVIGKQEESGMWDAAEIWNYPGFAKGLSGKQLLDRMMTQAIDQGVQFKKDEVVHIRKTVGAGSWNSEIEQFVIRTADRSEFTAHLLILAHGANYIKADLPGEQEFKEGVHYCALCDGPLHANENMIVIGNGNYAAEEAVQLSAFTKNLRLISNAGEFNISSEYLKLLEANGIDMINARVREIVGVQGRVTGVRLHHPDRAEAATDVFAYEAEAVFIAIGVASSGAFAQQLGLETAGQFLKTDASMRTNVPGVWAAGLCRGGVNQITKSVGDGGVAAVDLIKSLRGLPQYIDHG